MDVPLANGLQRECVFQVVRVSGTIRKVEEEAIRRSRVEVVRLANRLGEEGGRGGVLDDLFGGAGDGVGLMSEGDDDESDDESDG